MCIHPLVSIIVPTLNSSRTILFCLCSIKKQTYGRIEILVVDGGSSDNTIEIAKKFGVEVIKTDLKSVSRQRNIGMIYTNGELVFYCDSDEFLYPRLIEECVNIIVNEEKDALFISHIDTGRSYLGKSRRLGNIINLTLRKSVKIPNSQLRCFTRRVIMSVGGYDEELVVGEDVVLALKCFDQEFNISRCKYPILHYGIEGLSNIFLKKYNYGKKFQKYKEKSFEFGVLPTISYTLVGLFYLRHLFKFKKYARYIPGFFLLKLIEILGIIIGHINARAIV